MTPSSYAIRYRLFNSINNTEGRAPSGLTMDELDELVRNIRAEELEAVAQTWEAPTPATGLRAWLNAFTHRESERRRYARALRARANAIRASEEGT